MGNYRKRDFLSVLATLKRANQAMKNMEAENYPVMLNMLEKCKNAAIVLCKELESRGDAARSIIPIIEKYHEKVCRQSRVLSDKKKRKQGFSRIGGQLLLMEKILLKKLPQDKKEIVFLPYKASMWDSMESVWKAAIEDGECDVYVVPVPYFDRKPDGSFGQMHDESGEYPGYVPVTSWQRYDIETRRPDMLFIHNPYDDKNLVTSVHPRFYARNLKQFCRMLFYIPYYVSSNKTNYVKKKMEGMCATNGAFYADYVFVQSEPVKKAYQDAIYKVEKQQQCEGAFGNLEKKIVAIGSPKFDKAMHVKKEDYPLPDAWKRLIQNKKVIFFNTTIAAGLRYNERYLNKLRSVFSIFKNRRDIALWWRPHPLLEQTFASMRPALATAYRQIVEKYREGGFGIYDDSPELYRAIAWGDRYYGDVSSVVWLYGATGKPVLILGVRQRKREKFTVGWCTSDMEDGDLEDWLDGKEKWKTTKKFEEAFGGSLRQGEAGKLIYEFCVKAVRENELCDRAGRG